MLIYWEGGQFSKQIDLHKDNNWGFTSFLQLLWIRTYSQTIKGKYKEEQSNDNIEPVTPYNFKANIHETNELECAQKDDNQQKELWRWHLKLNDLSFPKIKLMAIQVKYPSD